MENKLKNNPLVSVVIPCYNHEQFVQEAIQSVIDQDYKNIELIVIDDGSKDNSVEVVKEMTEACRARFTNFAFIHRSNMGLCHTLNEGLALSAGVFVAPLASDDVLMPHRISTQISAFMRISRLKPQLVAIYSGVQEITSQGDFLRVKRGSGRYSDFKSVFLREDYLPTPTFLVLRKKLAEVGNFNADFAIEDLYIRLKLTLKGGLFYTLPEPLVLYRRHDDNMSKKSDYIWRGVLQILEEYKSHPLYKKALARSYLIQAHDYQIVDKRKGFKWMTKAITHNPALLFSNSLLRFMAKMLYVRK